LFNTGAERILGIDATAATGRELVEFIAPDDLARNAARGPGQNVFEALVDHAAGDLAPETRDWTWLPVGRSPLKVSMTTNPVIDTFGDLFGYLFVASDITDTRRSQEILVKALQRERQVVARLKDISQRIKDEIEAQTLDFDEDGFATLTVPIEEETWATREMTRVGAEVEVLEPASLRERMREIAHTLASFYAV
jgi:hypothetical protein